MKVEKNQYNDQKVMEIVNLVETMWIYSYSCPI